jgi:opacity protein-like surface antigen
MLGDFQAPELEPVKEYGAFFGLKITLKILGGWNTFSGGDIKTGIEGMYDNGVDYIIASGIPVLSNVKAPNKGGIEVGGDLIYAVTPRFGIGVGMAGLSAWKESHFLFNYDFFGPGTFQVRPRVKVKALRASLYYSLPFAGILAVSIRGGPAFYSAKYTSSIGSGVGFLRDGLIHTSYTQEASSKKWGFEGGLGLELTPNPFVAIFLEVQGRQAKIGDFEGEETATFFQDGQNRRTTLSGPVYIVDTAGKPQLDISPVNEAVPGNARGATLNFSGITYLAGLKFRL